MSYRNTRSAYLNCEKRIFDIENKYGFPQLQPCDIDLENPQCIGFNFAKSEKHPEDKILHFYLDDYQFMRVWRGPDRYIPMLSRFKAVLTPDFSMYTDFPKAVQIFNRYRSQWLGAYWQSNGITVIPTICWSDEDSFEWCFDGIPEHSIISISTVGCFNSKVSRAAWKRGYDECIKRLQPRKILLYGTAYEETEIDTNAPVEIVYVSNSNTDRLRIVSKTKKGETYDTN